MLTHLPLAPCARLVAVIAVLLMAGLIAPASERNAAEANPAFAFIEIGKRARDGHVTHPLVAITQGTGPEAARPLLTNPAPRGYTPAQVAAYLGLQGDGAGQTIAIVAPFDSPAVLADLNVFSATFGLPLACGTAGADDADCFHFRKKMLGPTAADEGWALEIALDVQWAHAVAPRADILLVEVMTDDLSSLMRGIDYAVARRASVISNSWGTDEFDGETRYDAHCRLRFAVCVFASGNSGNPGLYPAASPHALAVGGSTLRLTADGGVIEEVAWGGSGGGVSEYEPRPEYQATAHSLEGRGSPDVSYNASPATGFPVYSSLGYAGQSGWFRLGGTSVAAPQWAAIIAVANQMRAESGIRPLGSADVHQLLYSLSGDAALYDVGTGSNGGCGGVCQAGTGYDFVTGMGSPRTGIDAALAAAPDGLRSRIRTNP